MSKAFNRLWSASLVSNLSDGVLLAAAPLLAITLTDNTILISSGVVGALAFAIAADVVTIYLLIIAAFIIGTCEVAADTTSQSLIPQILDKEHFEKANSRLQISETVVQGFIGAPLSGFLYALAIYIPFFFNSVGYIVSAVLALSMPIHFLQDVRNEKPKSEQNKIIS